MDAKLSWIVILRAKFFLFFLFFVPALFAQSVVIGIAGALGAGKTTLARKLKNSLGDRVSIICQDNIRDQYLKTVRPMFLKHIAPSKSFADLIIPNENDNELVLDFISGQLSQMITPTLTYNPPLGQSDA